MGTTSNNASLWGGLGTGSTNSLLPGGTATSDGEAIGGYATNGNITSAGITLGTDSSGDGISTGFVLLLAVALFGGYLLLR